MITAIYEVKYQKRIHNKKANTSKKKVYITLIESNHLCDLFRPKGVKLLKETERIEAFIKEDMKGTYLTHHRVFTFWEIIKINIKLLVCKITKGK